MSTAHAAPGTIVIVSNPTAGRGRDAEAVSQAAESLRTWGREVLQLPVRSMEEAHKEACELVSTSTDIAALVVVGGDGMVHLGVGAVALSQVPLGIVATGTGNDVARYLGLPRRDPEAAALVIHEALSHPERVRALDAIRTTRPHAQAETATWSLAVVSAGLDAAVNATANSLRWPSGEGRYLRAISREIRNLTPYGYRLTTDSATWEGTALLVAAANTGFFGGGLPIAPCASANDGLLDVIRLDAVGLPRLLVHLARLSRGEHLGHEGVHLERSRQVLIEPLPVGPGRATPPQAMADGEPLGTLPLHAEVVPGAVKVLLPR